MTKVLFRFTKNLRLLNLSSKFYDYFSKKSKQTILSKENDSIKNNELNKIKASLIKNSAKTPVQSPVEKDSIDKKCSFILSDSTEETQDSSEEKQDSSEEKQDSLNQIQINKLSDNNQINKPIEYIKFLSVFKKDQSQMFDKLNFFNKFVFDSTVKNQIKLQNANKDNTKIAEINTDVLTNMKALLSVVLDNLNQI
jgi:hypothetical protein